MCNSDVAGGSIPAGAPAGDGAAPTPAEEPGGRHRAAPLGNEAARAAAGYFALGLPGIGLLALALPAGSLQSTMVDSRKAAPLVTAPIALAAYLKACWETVS